MGSQMNMNLQQQPMQQQQPHQGGQGGGVQFGGGGGGFVSRSKSKFFDDVSQNEFVQNVRPRIQQILGNNRFAGNVNEVTAAINKASDECLKQMKKPNYKFVSHTLLVPLNSPYNMGDSKYWKSATDVCMTV